MDIDLSKVTNETEVEKVFTPDFRKALATTIAESVASAMGEVTKGILTAQKATVGGTGSWNMLHGRGSLFGAAQVGIEPDVVSAMMMWQGLGEHIPIKTTPYYETFLPFITGVDPLSTTEPTDECDDCIAGETEACLQHFPLGRVCRETQPLSVDRIIERLNRGDIDLRLLNDQLGSESPWHPGEQLTSGNQIMQIATAWALMFELPPLFAQALGPMVWNGNPTNNTIGDGYREFRGLDLLVNTGFVDALTNVACPALDSDVKQFNYGDVVTQTAPSFWQTLEMAHYYVMHNARGMRLMPCQWGVVMRPELWHLLSQVIPAQKIMAAMMNFAAAAGITVNVDGNTMVQERNNLYQSMRIPVNGQLLPVILDDGITELNNATDANLAAGEYAANVYVLPMTYLGNRDALYIEHKDFRQIRSQIAAVPGNIVSDFYQPSADGRFAWNAVKNGWCFKVQAKIEPRIVLRTPQLAARIDDVKYVPLQHLRSPDPDSPYRAKGGISLRSPSSYYYESR